MVLGGNNEREIKWTTRFKKASNVKAKSTLTKGFKEQMNVKDKSLTWFQEANSVKGKSEGNLHCTV